MALAHPFKKSPTTAHLAMVTVGLFGAALLYGDSVLTPAISVLSAVEGLKFATHVFEPFIIPITLAILVFMFLMQRRGTQKIGTLFGPVILIWFATLIVLGIRSIITDTDVLFAVNPMYAVHYFTEHGLAGFPVLGAVFLTLTGAEALYADMGHFGRKPIQAAWYWIVFPALLINYFGQGALLLQNPKAIENPFYALAPDWFLLPLVIIATIATVVASQATISGAFSVTRQAVQLGYLPRLEILHTSSDEIGQIYVPLVNWCLLAMTIWLVLTFHSSSNLAAAYGIAVSMTMVITALLSFIVARTRWKFSLWLCVPTFLVFLVVDIIFCSANMLKVLDGGYVSLIMSVVIFTIMTTWKKGREILGDRLKSALITPERFIKQVAPTFPHRLPGTAICMARSINLIPAALFHNVKHNQVLHEQVVLVSVRTEEIPHVPLPGRVEVEGLGSGFWSVIVHYGFMDTPNIPEAMRLCADQGLHLDPVTVTYFLSRETLIATPVPGMAMWRERMFAFMTRNAQRAANYFQIPSHQIVEIGIQIEL